MIADPDSISSRNMNIDNLTIARNQNNDLPNKYLNEVRRDQPSTSNFTARSIDETLKVPVGFHLINNVKCGMSKRIQT